MEEEIKQQEQCQRSKEPKIVKTENYFISKENESYASEKILAISSINDELNQQQDDKPALIAASNLKGDVYFLNLNSHEVVEKFGNLQFYIPSLTFMDYHSLLLCAGSDAHIIDLEKKKQVRQFQGHNQTLLCADFNIFRNLIATGGYDRTILLWDKRTAKPVNCILAHSHEMNSLRFSEDSMHLLSSANDGFTRIWSVHTGLCRKTLCVDNSSIPSCSRFSKNGKFVLLSTLKNLVTLWDWEKSEIVKQYQGHVNDTLYLQNYFIEEKGIPKNVMVYSEDSQVYLYDTMSEEIVLRERIEDNPVSQKKIYMNDKVHNQNSFYIFSHDSISIEQYKIINT